MRVGECHRNMFDCCLPSELYPYSFYGASLAHLNLGLNSLVSLSENAFLGLEGNLKSLNLKSNMFKSFPMSAVRNLQNLEDLNLGNKIAIILLDFSVFTDTSFSNPCFKEKRNGATYKKPPGSSLRVAPFSLHRAGFQAWGVRGDKMCRAHATLPSRGHE